MLLPSKNTCSSIVFMCWMDYKKKKLVIIGFISMKRIPNQLPKKKKKKNLSGSRDLFCLNEAKKKNTREVHLSANRIIFIVHFFFLLNSLFRWFKGNLCSNLELQMILQLADLFMILMPLSQFYTFLSFRLKLYRIIVI